MRPMTSSGQRTAGIWPMFLFVFTICILFAICHLPFSINISYAEEVTILYTGQTHALLYPCNCPKEPDGGIARRANLVKTLKKRFPQALLLDSGGFFAGGPLDQYSQGDEMDMLRTAVNLKAMALMQYDAAVIGVDEFNFGQEFLEKSIGNSSIAFLSCNIQSQEIFSPYIIKQVGNTKIGIIGVTSPAVMPKLKGLTLLTPKVAAAQAVKELKQKGCDLIVLLSTLLENEEFDLIDNVAGIDVMISYNIAISTDANAPAGPSSLRGTTLILRPSWQGRRLDKVSLTLKNKRIISHKAEELRLSDEIVGDPEILSFLPACFSDNNCRKQGFIGKCQDPGAMDAACVFTELVPVNLSVITSKSCRTCNTEQAERILRQWFPGLVVSYLYYPEERAQNLIRDFGIKALPAYLLGKEIEKEKVFSEARLNEHSEKKGDFYMLKPELIGFTYLLDRKEIRGRLDLFISIYTKNCKELLDVVKVFNPQVHFLAIEEKEGFDAAVGNIEVEEYLRAVCVQKYYPASFWNYIGCRAAEANSSWWQDCAASLDTDKIKTCAQGSEGKELLKENIKLNKELGVMFGPTYFVHNKEIFSSQGLPSQEELKKVISE